MHAWLVFVLLQPHRSPLGQACGLAQSGTRVFQRVAGAQPGPCSLDGPWRVASSPSHPRVEPCVPRGQWWTRTDRHMRVLRHEHTPQPACIQAHTHTRSCKQKLVLFHSLCLEAVSELERGLEGRGYGRSFRVPSLSMAKVIAPDHHPVGLSGKGGQCLFGISSMCPWKGPCQASTELERAWSHPPSARKALAPDLSGRKQEAGRSPSCTRGSSHLGPGGARREVVPTSTGCSFPPLCSLFFLHQEDLALPLALQEPEHGLEECGC